MSAGSVTDPRIRELDGIRFVAATSVFCYHALIGVPWMSEHLGRYLVHLNLGVRIFYVLSGFLISIPFARRALASRPGPGLVAYVVRRLARIFPAYWLALAVLLLAGSGSFRSTRDAIGQLTLTFLWFPPPGQVFTIIAVAGTVVVELAFYAFVPAWFALLAGARRLIPTVDAFTLHLCACVGLVVVGGLGIWRAAYGDPGPFVVHFVTALPALASGMALAVLAAGRSARPALDTRLHDLVRVAGWWWLAAVAAFAVLSSQRPDFPLLTPPQVVWQLVWEPVVAVLVVTPIVLGGAQPVRSAIGRFLRWRPIAWIGLVSYGLYLWHGWALSWLDDTRLQREGGAATLVALALVVLAYAGAVALAAVSWYLVERPIHRAATRITRRSDRAATNLRG